MDLYDFNLEMRNLRLCFPTFGEGKTEILFDMIKSLSREQFNLICKTLIKNHKTAPSISDFLELKRVFVREEQTEAILSNDDFKKNNHNIFTDQERSEIFKTIVDIASGKIPKDQAKQFQDLLISAIKNKDPSYFLEKKYQIE